MNAVIKNEIAKIALEMLNSHNQRKKDCISMFDKIKYRDIAISLRCNYKRLDYKGKALFIDSLVQYYMKYDRLVLNKEFRVGTY